MEAFDPTDIDEQDRAKAEQAEAVRVTRDTESADFRWLMGSRRGRRIVWRMLERAGVFRSSFSANSMGMAFAEGCKNEGLRILNQIHTLCPDQYSVMTKEATNDNRND